MICTRIRPEKTLIAHQSPNRSPQKSHPNYAVDLYDLHREAFQLPIPKFEDPERP